MSKTQVFIEKARAKHGDRYDYSKTVYVRQKDKVIITCKEHGDFQQIATNHLSGSGCARCGFESMAIKRSQEAKDGFIERSRAVHGDRYDYGCVAYVRDSDKVIITCAKHGDFEQAPKDHLDGRGCAKCGFESMAIKQSQESKNSFIEKACAIHGDKYDYLKTVYVRSKDKVTINCKEHGDFEQAPYSHLNGNGCPRCLFNRDQPTAVYLMQMGARVKIGVSTNLESRLSIINRHNPEPARIVTTWTLKDFPTAYIVEQKLHQRLRDYHAGLTGFDGATEWFNTTPCHAEWVINKAVQYANEVCKL